MKIFFNVKDKGILSALHKTITMMMLLLISGNVTFSPGSQDVPTSYSTLADFQIRFGLVFVHLNVQSLLPKMDTVHIWIKNTNTDVLVISKTCFKSLITDNAINIEGCNAFGIDQPKRGVS